jgi:glutamate carboxypeptidase
MRKRILFLLLLTSVLKYTKAQKLTHEERRIVHNVNKKMPHTLQLLKELVNINSGTLNIEGVKKVGEVLGKQFESIGFTTTWVTLPDSLKRAGHLVAYKKGHRGKKLFLIGHLDTVFEPDMPANPYRKLNDTTATGQGANDMKGGDLVILAALQALQSAGLLKDVSITAYFTGDEEKTGIPIEVSRADFIERAKQSDIALGFEGAQGLNTVATARRGASGWKLKVYGKQGHSGGIFSNGYGAIYEAARIINTFREELSEEQYLTFNPGVFVGGSEVVYDSANMRADVSGKTNIISPSAIVQGDLRFLTDKQKEAARAKMKTIALTNNLAGTRAEILFTDNVPGMEPTEGNNRLLKVLSKVTADLGFGPTKAGDPGSRGAGDISYIAKYVDCLDGLGASGRGAHAPGETINLAEFPQLIERAALLIYRLTR